MNKDDVCQCCHQAGFDKWADGFPSEVLCDDAIQCLDRVARLGNI